MKKYFIYIISLIIIPGLLLLGQFVFDNKQYDIIYLAIAVFSLIPFFLTFERRLPQARELVLIAVITAIAVASRMVFAWVPSFKPVAAIIIIAAIAFGKEVGFMIGALTALLSNIYFGQGPWTPFQMFGWGFVGLAAGMLRKTFIMKNLIFLTIFAIFAGLLYSLILDIQTMLLIDKSFNFGRYLAIIASSFPFTLTYMISNAIFIVLLAKPLLKKFDRIKDKYGMFLNENALQ